MTVKPNKHATLLALVLLCGLTTRLDASTPSGRIHHQRVRRQTGNVSLQRPQVGISTSAIQDATRPIASLAGQLGGALASASASGTGLTGEAQLGGFGIAGALSTRRPTQPLPLVQPTRPITSIGSTSNNIMEFPDVELNGSDELTKPSRRRPSISERPSSEENEVEHDDDHEYRDEEGDSYEFNSHVFHGAALEPLDHGHLAELFGKLRGFSDEDMKSAAGIDLGLTNSANIRPRTSLSTGNNVETRSTLAKMRDGRSETSRLESQDVDDDADDYEENDVE